MKNTQRALRLSLCMAGSSLLAPAIAGAAVDIIVAPPAPRVEVVPAPRAGYVWAPGYWAWRGHEHVWVSGRWLAERHGYHWVPDRWEQHHDHWHYYHGYWAR